MSKFEPIAAIVRLVLALSEAATANRTLPPEFCTNSPAQRAVAIGIAPAGQSSALLYISIVPVLLFSWLMLRVVDDPVERARVAVKRKFAPREPQ